MDAGIWRAAGTEINSNAMEGPVMHLELQQFETKLFRIYRG